MEKNKKSKKFWTWTEKQRRRRLRGRYGKTWSSGPTKAFTHSYEVTFRSHNKMTLKKIVLGVTDEDEARFLFSHRHSAGWYWW